MKNKTLLPACVVLVVVALLGAIWWYLPSRSIENADHLGATVALPADTSHVSNEMTIANAWDWQALAAVEKQQQSQANKQESTAAFDVAIIYDKLQDVRMNEMGDVILDDKALKALDETLAYSGLELSDADVEFANRQTPL